MSVARGTTPTFTLTFSDDIDLTEATSVYVTIKSGGKLITKTGDDLEVTETTIAVSLSQKECFLLQVGDCEIQANWITDEKRIASEVATYTIEKNLLNEVIE